MAKVFSILNHKGGVGKTTTAANLGGFLSLRGFRVLLVDLDAQANLTFTLCPDASGGRTIYNAFKEGRDLPVVEARKNLFVSPSSFEFAGVELEVYPKSGREHILRDLLSPLLPRFDVVLLDCPPSVGLVTINALAASTEAVTPVVAEALPFQGLTAIEGFISRVRGGLNPSLSLSGIVLCRWEGRKLNKMVEEALRGKYGDLVFRSVIRSSIAVAEAPLAQSLIAEYGARSRGAGDYEALASEFVGRFSLETHTDAPEKK